MNDYAADCIHLKACRRARKMAENISNKYLVLNCNEYCSAYISGNSGGYTTIENAYRVGRSALASMEYGQSKDDCLFVSDFETRSLNEIIEEAENG